MLICRDPFCPFGRLTRLRLTVSGMFIQYRIVSTEWLQEARAVCYIPSLPRSGLARLPMTSLLSIRTTLDSTSRIVSEWPFALTHTWRRTSPIFGYALFNDG